MQLSNFNINRRRFVASLFATDLYIPSQECELHRAAEQDRIDGCRRQGRTGRLRITFDLSLVLAQEVLSSVVIRAASQTCFVGT